MHPRLPESTSRSRAASASSSGCPMIVCAALSGRRVAHEAGREVRAVLWGVEAVVGAGGAKGGEKARAPRPCWRSRGAWASCPSAPRVLSRAPPSSRGTPPWASPQSTLGTCGNGKSAQSGSEKRRRAAGSGGGHNVLMEGHLARLALSSRCGGGPGSCAKNEPSEHPSSTSCRARSASSR